MKVNIPTNSVSCIDIEKSLTKRFQGITIISNSKDFLTLKKSSFVGATILLKKNRIIIAGNFPKKRQQYIFSILVILFGIIIPLAIYFIFYHKGLSVFEKEIGSYLQQEFKKI
jgi:hypothetical protein